MATPGSFGPTIFWRTAKARRKCSSAWEYLPRSCSTDARLSNVVARLSSSGSNFSQIAKARLKRDRKSTRLNSSHGYISYAVFCLKKKKELTDMTRLHVFIVILTYA